MKSATIDDVAKLAGVSRMTVSRVLNSSGSVKDETRRCILSAIDALNYRPNAVARSLVTGRNRTLAYVMVNISDPFHNLVSQGIESVAFSSQYTTLMCDAHDEARLQDYIDLFRDSYLGGVIFHHLSMNEDQINLLESSGIYCVLMDNEIDIPGTCMVNTDNSAGAAMAVDYLVSKGHRHIGCVHGLFQKNDMNDPIYEDTFQFDIWHKRKEGYLAAMRSHGLQPGPFLQSNGRFEKASDLSRDIARSLITMQNRPTALYCQNDMMAIALINALQEYGIRVPSDMAIIGHDGLDICTMLHPYITTVAQPRFEMGLEAAAMLIERIESKSAARYIKLQPKLIIGETV